MPCRFRGVGLSSGSIGSSGKIQDFSLGDFDNSKGKPVGRVFKSIEVEVPRMERLRKRRGRMRTDDRGAIRCVNSSILRIRTHSPEIQNFSVMYIHLEFFTKNFTFFIFNTMTQYRQQAQTAIEMGFSDVQGKR